MLGPVSTLVSALLASSAQQHIKQGLMDNETQLEGDGDSISCVLPLAADGAAQTQENH